MADDSDGYGGGFSGGNYGFSGTPSGGSGLSMGGGNVGFGSSGGYSPSNNFGMSNNYGSGANYGLSSGHGNQGLSVGNSTIGGLGDLGSTNYGFGGLGTDQGFNGGGYNLAPNLGTGTLADIYNFSPNFDYGFSAPGATGYSSAGNPNLGFTGSGQEGLRALANGPDYALSQGVGGLGITGKENGTENTGWNHPGVALLSKVLNIAPQTRPLGMALGMAQGLATGNISDVVGRVNPLAGAALSNDPMRSGATTIANRIGGEIGGQALGGINPALGAVGAMYGGNALGGLMNTAFGQARQESRDVGAFGNASPMQAGVQSAQNTSSSVSGDGGTNWGNLAALAGKGLGAYQAMRGSSQMASNAANTNAQLQQSMQGLSSMYSPQGAYAQQLRQELARRDAKAGRNSQYGPREVELQAALAKMQLQAAQGMSGLANASSNNAAPTASANQSQIQTLAQILSAAGDKKTQEQMSSAWGDLKGLFS